MGVISKRMAQRDGESSSSEFNSTELVSKGKPQQQAVILHHPAHTKVHLMTRSLFFSCFDLCFALIFSMQKRTFSHKAIKRLMVKELSMSMMDTELVEQLELPSSGFIDTLSIPVQDCRPLFLSILPAIPGASTANDEVPWSVYFPGQSKEKAFILDASWGFPEFLIRFCKFHFSFAGRIDYTIFLFQKPLIFGMAFILLDQHPELTSFYFARILCSKEMSHMLMG